jgi:hypothetical protein
MFPQRQLPVPGTGNAKRKRSRGNKAILKLANSWTHSAIANPQISQVRQSEATIRNFCY